MARSVVDGIVPPRKSFRIVTKKVDYSYATVSEYRIQMQGKFKYLVVDASLFKEEFILQRLSDDYQLPSVIFDVPDWTLATISVRYDYYDARLKNCSSKPIFDISYRYTPLESVRELENWEKPSVDVSNLNVAQVVSDEVQVVLYGLTEGECKVAIAKFAPFESDVDALTNELQVYRDVEGKRVAPHFLAYITENERIVGFLLEFLQGKKARADHYTLCKEGLKRLHT